MKRNFLTNTCAISALVLASVAPAIAQDADTSSPFAFAQSGAKAERAAEIANSDSAGRVIGGELADQGEWPWQVGLMIAGQPVSPDAHFCGGSMILDEWVLTAAHCVYMPDGEGGFFQLDPSQFNVIVGTNTIAPGQGDVVPIEAVFRHPAYDGNEFDNDIALIKLARNPRTNYDTIQVPDTEFGDILDQPGVPTTVTGWGLNEGGSHPADMYEADIQVMGRDMCNGLIMEARAQYAAQYFGEAATTFNLSDDDAQEAWVALIERAPLPLSDNMICSGTFEGGKTACQGDSGGPLVVPLNDGTFVQAGVVSWGLSAANGKTCAEDAIFSAYTKVSNFVDWLDQIIANN